MNYDKFGVAHCTADELCKLIYQNPDLDVTKFSVDDPGQYNTSIHSLFVDLDLLRQYQDQQTLYNSLEEFDTAQQSNWHMPDEYKGLDIAQWILDQCKTDAELQRVGEELLLYQERDLFNLLRYLKYFVDTMRKNNIVWGLGRGSSVASYVLYLLGVHKVNSMYYDLDISEFLR